MKLSRWDTTRGIVNPLGVCEKGSRTSETATIRSTTRITCRAKNRCSFQLFGILFVLGDDFRALPGSLFEELALQGNGPLRTPEMELLSAAKIGS